MNDYEARRYDAREAMANPPDWTCGATSHRYVDINDPPAPEMIVCYRCGMVRSRSNPIGSAPSSKERTP